MSQALTFRSQALTLHLFGGRALLVWSGLSVGGLVICSSFASRTLVLLRPPLRILAALVAEHRHRPLPESSLCPLASHPSFGSTLRASDPVVRGYSQHISAQAPAFKLGFVIPVDSILPSLMLRPSLKGGARPSEKNEYS